ncbi:MAG: hypothetical protein IPM45_17780 [Acidimicrobiales bacterium]|nr:hypothetical protein [Acidimicrobiales bacterium]
MKDSEVGLLALGPLVEHAVELGEHVLHALHLLGAHVAHGPGHLVDVALHQLLAEPVEELLEPLLGLGRREVVLLQLAHLAGKVGRQEIEPRPTLGGGLLPSASRSNPVCVPSQRE